MKLIFNKNDDNEISIQLKSGEQVEEFSYTIMIKYLLTENEFEDIEYNNLNDEEEQRIKVMINQILEKVKSSRSD